MGIKDEILELIPDFVDLNEELADPDYPYHDKLKYWIDLWKHGNYIWRIERVYLT
ncbi:hypothetical protein [Mycoplasma yeatsii]|uniref:Uncharacterized protein n=1 Tax=Mycoplasma yeatsii TaxID=51365 RepID=A0ABU0NEL6_9MOLU|nr:hypothetical protein [Mycoplasma yeatsii]MDQ0567877.1 hypothetical protein [Mycoplasma yeatsii]